MFKKEVAAVRTIEYRRRTMLQPRARLVQFIKRYLVSSYPSRFRVQLLLFLFRIIFFYDCRVNPRNHRERGNLCVFRPTAGGVLMRKRRLVITRDFIPRTSKPIFKRTRRF